MTVETVDFVFEERVKKALVEWMGGENLVTAAKMITEMAKEAADESYAEGYRFAKNETALLEKAATVLDDE